MPETFVRAVDLPNTIKFKVRTDSGLDYREVPFQNFMYIKTEQYEMHQELLSRVSNLVSEFVPDGEYTKVYLKNNWLRQKTRATLEENGFTVYEGDVSAFKRYLIQHQQLNLNPWNLQALFYDIETKDDGAFQKDSRGAIIATEPILSIYLEDQNGNGKFFKNENKEDILAGEKDLLVNIKTFFEQFDIVLAWNGARFDDTYIKQRNDFHKISNGYWDFLNQCDYMEMVDKNIKGLESKALDSVANRILGRGKLEVGGEKGKGAIYKAWLDSFEGDNRLEMYNVEDVKLMIDIEKKLKFLELHKKQSELCHCFIQETMHNTDMLDYALINEFNRRGIIVDSKPNDALVKEHEKLGNIGGAYTFCLQPGFHEELLVFDFKSYYATTISQYNICVTTIGQEEYFKENNIPYCIVPTDDPDGRPNRYYRTDKRGIIAEVVHSYIEERDKIKYEMDKYKISEPEKYRQMYLHQYALKTMGNSVYGALAFKFFRFFNWNMGDSITTGCRYLIKRCVQRAEDLGFIVVQGDTDSIIFKKGENCQMTPKQLEENLADMFDEYADLVNLGFKFQIPDVKNKGQFRPANHFIVFEHEKTYDSMIAIKKKNYASLMVFKDPETGEEVKEIDIKGLECKKRDTNPLAKIMQKELVEKILRKELNWSDFLKEIIDLREKTEKMELPIESLIMKKALGKKPEDYGGIMYDKKTGKPKIGADGNVRTSPVPAHVKLAIRMQEEGLDVYQGDSIKFIVKSKVPKINAISLEEFEKEKTYDKAYYWERITKPIIKVLAAVNRQFALDNAMLLIMLPEFTKTGNPTKPLTEVRAEKKMHTMLNKIIEEEEKDESD